MAAAAGHTVAALERSSAASGGRTAAAAVAGRAGQLQSRNLQVHLSHQLQVTQLYERQIASLKAEHASREANLAAGFAAHEKQLETWYAARESQQEKEYAKREADQKMEHSKREAEQKRWQAECEAKLKMEHTERESREKADHADREAKQKADHGEREALLKLKMEEMKEVVAQTRDVMTRGVSNSIRWAVDDYADELNDLHEAAHQAGSLEAGTLECAKWDMPLSVNHFATCPLFGSRLDDLIDSERQQDPEHRALVKAHHRLKTLLSNLLITFNERYVLPEQMILSYRRFVARFLANEGYDPVLVAQRQGPPRELNAQED